MIIWLASYPKSGNTWVRGFINSLLYTNDGSSNLQNISNIKQYPVKSHFINLVSNFNNISEIKKNWITSQNILNLDKKIKILKTHNAFCNIEGDNFTDNKNTLGVIHIIRDPRNVITSVKNYFSKKNLDLAKEFLFDEKRHILSNEKVGNFPLVTPIFSWGGHYKSWSLIKKNYLLIKYENLIKNPKKEFGKIKKYLSKILKINFSEQKVNKSIYSNSFNNLKEQEEKFGFDENSILTVENKKIPFFNLGPNNNWKEMISKDLSLEIEKKFYEEMRETGYISRN